MGEQLPGSGVPEDDQCSQAEIQSAAPQEEGEGVRASLESESFDELFADSPKFYDANGDELLEAPWRIVSTSLKTDPATGELYWHSESRLLSITVKEANRINHYCNSRGLPNAIGRWSDVEEARLALKQSRPPTKTNWLMRHIGILASFNLMARLAERHR